MKKRAWGKRRDSAFTSFPLQDEGLVGRWVRYKGENAQIMQMFLQGHRVSIAIRLKSGKTITVTDEELANGLE